MRNIRLFIVVIICLILSGPLWAQQQYEKRGVENVFVEIYHIAEDETLQDSNGQTIPKGTVTYRIYVDMVEGYKLQAMYGIKDHPLIFKTTTQFYNQVDWGSSIGSEVLNRQIEEYGVALDSWLTMGPASRKHIGVRLSDDTDGTILPFPGFESSDGLLEFPNIPAIIKYGINLDLFEEEDNQGHFYTEDGVLAILGGIQGLDKQNLVLVAQLTTDGALSFELNFQVNNPDCGTENYVARNPKSNEIKSEFLIYPKP
ncbi:MAG: hypothetical protein K9H49_19190 [Bacteroidales bacterium]|nr:hypothetical protein [Bacteroidales bacterium]MCF8391756.1 hypothetical protein [Bacteroidales bacterium]